MAAKSDERNRKAASGSQVIGPFKYMSGPLLRKTWDGTMPKVMQPLPGMARDPLGLMPGSAYKSGKRK